MISKTHSSNILNALMGVSSYTTPANVYLGLCASEPDAKTGALTNAGEPTSVASYARKLVGGTGSGVEKYFETSASTGKISNGKEIQMKTARENYPAKINYWFLSTSDGKNTIGVAYMWGKIKDVLSKKMTVEGFVSEFTYNKYSATTTVENLLDLYAGTKYIVYWDEKEYEEEAVSYEKDGTSYIRLGNALVSGGSDDGKPFGILYNETTTGTETTGTLTIYSMTDESSHEVAIYGIGIEIKNATVPTFYEGELTASIDV